MPTADPKRTLRYETKGINIFSMFFKLVFMNNLTCGQRQLTGNSLCGVYLHFLFVRPTNILHPASPIKNGWFCCEMSTPKRFNIRLIYLPQHNGAVKLGKSLYSDWQAVGKIATTYANLYYNKY